MKTCNAQELTVQEQLAEAQILGFHYCRLGSSMRELVVSMGLSKEEWENIKNTGLPYLPDSLTEEIEEYFTERKNENV